MRRVLVHAATAVLVSLGCSEPGPADAGGAFPEWTVAREPRFTVGGEDQRAEYQLFRVTGATVLSDGRLVIANSGTSELRYYSPEGVHLVTSGREGDGPGEVRGLMELVALGGDSLLTLSFRPGLTWWDPFGNFVRSERVDLWSIGVPCRIGEGNWHALPDGSLLSLLEDNFYGEDCPPLPPSPWRQTGLIGRSDLGGGALDTLGIFPATERNSPNYRVFGKSLLMAWDTAAVYATDTGSPEILKLGMNGDTLAIWPTPFEAEVIPERAKREAVREFERPDGSIERGNEYLYPDHYPRVGRLLLARTGELWVMRYPPFTEPTTSWRLERAFAFLVEEGGARWRVLDQSGEVVAEVHTPDGVFPLEIGEDYVVGLSRDANDVEAVSVYDLIR